MWPDGGGPEMAKCILLLWGKWPFQWLRTTIVAPNTTRTIFTKITSSTTPSCAPGPNEVAKILVRWAVKLTKWFSCHVQLITSTFHEIRATLEVHWCGQKRTRGLLTRWSASFRTGKAALRPTSPVFTLASPLIWTGFYLNWNKCVQCSTLWTLLLKGMITLCLMFHCLNFPPTS